MSTLHKTLKCLFEICYRRDTVYKVLYRSCFTERYLEYVCVSHIKSVENDIMPKRNKKVKLDWSKLPKFYCNKKKKTDSKKSNKEQKCGKSKSITSQFLTESDATECVEINDSDDIMVVFDSTGGKRKKTDTSVTSSDSEDSNNMGEGNSECLDQPVFGNVLQNNVPVDWTSYFVTSAQTSSCFDQSVLVPKLPSLDTSDSHHKDGPERRKLKEMRKWKYTKFGSNVGGGTMPFPHMMFTLLSYNVLAQDLLESHPYLYKKHNPKALQWEHRRQLLLKEIQEAEADIMCLQELQASHVDSFYSDLKNLGYEGIYKKRTGENVDGVAIYYKKELFKLVDYTSVEYFQPGIDVLNRDNVGLIAKLAVKKRTENMQQQHLVVATTHLLFNPRRHDVKLAQMQLLLTEIERYAFKGFKNGYAGYWPLIVTGDMNFKPHTGVYKLVTEGMFRYEGLSNRTLEDNAYIGTRILEKKLLPRTLDILDTCQHWGVLCKRTIEKMDHKTELRLLKIYNTDHQRIMREMNMTKQAPRSFEDFVENARSEGLINNFVPSFGPSPIPPMPNAGYATGQLTHNFNLQSVYGCHETDGNKSKVTTHQGRWVTVDYIFFSNKQNNCEGDLKLVAKYHLLSAEEANSMGPIPNMASPSDHYPLMAMFYLKL